MGKTKNSKPRESPGTETMASTQQDRCWQCIRQHSAKARHANTSKSAMGYTDTNERERPNRTLHHDGNTNGNTPQKPRIKSKNNTETHKRENMHHVRMLWATTRTAHDELFARKSDESGASPPKRARGRNRRARDSRNIAIEANTTHCM